MQTEPALVFAAWKEVTGADFNTREYQLPKAEDVLKLGQKLGVDTVMFTRVKWHVKSIWQGLGPKTRAEAHVDIWIVDVAKGEFVLKAEGIKGNDTEKEPGWKTAATLLVAPISVVSGGPETPRMARAGTVGFDKAIAKWVEAQPDTKIRSGG